MWNSVRMLSKIFRQCSDRFIPHFICVRHIFMTYRSDPQSQLCQVEFRTLCTSNSYRPARLQQTKHLLWDVYFITLTANSFELSGWKKMTCSVIADFQVILCPGTLITRCYWKWLSVWPWKFHFPFFLWNFTCTNCWTRTLNPCFGQKFILFQHLSEPAHKKKTKSLNLWYKCSYCLGDKVKEGALHVPHCSAEHTVGWFISKLANTV